MRKYFGMFAVSLMLAGACGGADEPSPDQTADVQQHSMNGGGSGGYTAPNGYTTYYTATTINTTGTNGTNGVPIRGIHSLSGSWYVMDATNDYAALIDYMSYQRQTVTALSSSQGWFYVTLSGQNTSTQVPAQSGGPVLYLHVASPFSGYIAIQPSGVSNASSGQRYYSVFSPDNGAGSTYMNLGIENGFAYNEGNSYYNDYLIPISGTKWDLNTGATTADANAITFASGFDAVGRCVGWGYEPWGVWSRCNSRNCTVSMAPYHQACARMKRADFCGDGRSWTDAASTPLGSSVTIQLWDGAGVHAMTPQTPSTMEASWSPTGASCVNMNELRVPAGMSDHAGHQFDAATSCSQPIPTCTSSLGSYYTASARPCTQTDASGNCIAN